jgi:periplasmic protein TonB
MRRGSRLQVGMASTLSALACVVSTGCATAPPDLSSPPVPANDQGKWLTLRDYPNHSSAEGVVYAELTVGINGRVADCKISQSSGDGRLDHATCHFLARRARFVSAKNESGETIEGSYSFKMEWQIPE